MWLLCLKLNPWLKKPFFRIPGDCNVGNFEQAHCSSAEEAARCFGFVGGGKKGGPCPAPSGFGER